MQQGWIKLHRSLLEHFVWTDKPFNMGAAWVDLVLMANYDKNKVSINGIVVRVERGQIFTSYRFLAERWGWSLGRVKRFIDVLESEEMMTVERSKNGTRLTLVNYSNFQDVQNTNGTPTEHQRNTDGTLTEQNKEIKKDKKVKEEKKDIYTSDIAEVLDYLNSRTGKKFTGKSKAHRQHIVARLKEGFTVEDFKKVIDNKVAAWGHSEKMAPYLRPETLFSTKFETYLNDVETERQKQKREEREIHEQQLKAIRMASDFDVGFLQ